MPDDTRDRTGPLSGRQRLILQRLAEGHLHSQIGKEIGVSREYIGRIIAGGILPKLRLNRTSQAIALYGRYKGLIQASVKLKEGILPYPGDPAEEHVNHVLEVLATELRRQANDLLP